MSKITELREQAGLTQRQLADFIGVDPSTIRNWERNRNSIESFVRFAKLCEALNCEPSELYSVEDPAMSSEDLEND
ncbi:helix-turn-helix transcriptional regulator [Leptolyngbya sp. BC1307]|uniref:helix-turn-helix domain-containing protein n=1 Tax=Leptolyngbya sp. BC1307 TaxID=2029589 RepID=UPI001F0A54E5|nr:helix-turn-helix transcriptional regulator [Leptolyngbya sp. BC1307]